MARQSALCQDGQCSVWNALSVAEISTAWGPALPLLSMMSLVFMLLNLAQ
jgi:hypothetical protein